MVGESSLRASFTPRRGQTLPGPQGERGDVSEGITPAEVGRTESSAM
jgi:hypothetical protein